MHPTQREYTQLIRKCDKMQELDKFHEGLPLFLWSVTILKWDFLKLANSHLVIYNT